MPDIEIEVKSFDDQLEDAYRQLLPEQRNENAMGKLQWRFCEGKFSKSVFSVAKDKVTGAVVGMNAFLATEMKIFDNLNATGYQSMDTVVLPEYRRCGLFTKLINAFYDESQNLSASLIYGFPNNKSGPGLFNKLMWTRFSFPPFLVKPLRAGYFVQKFFGKKLSFCDFPLSFVRQSDHSHSIIINNFDERFDRFWAKLLPSFSCVVHRDSKFLNWRLSSHPTTKYTTKAVVSDDGEIRAFITYVSKDKHGGKIGYLMEALSLPGSEKDLSMLIRNMIAEFNILKHDAILAWSSPTSPSFNVLKNMSFFVLPEKLAPIKLSFGARLLANIHAQNIKYEDWYISYLDSDTV
jgi:hypothetical protein